MRTGTSYRTIIDTSVTSFFLVLLAAAFVSASEPSIVWEQYPSVVDDTAFSAGQFVSTGTQGELLLIGHGGLISGSIATVIQASDGGIIDWQQNFGNESTKRVQLRQTFPNDQGGVTAVGYILPWYPAQAALLYVVNLDPNGTILDTLYEEQASTSFFGEPALSPMNSGGFIFANQRTRGLPDTPYNVIYVRHYSADARLVWDKEIDSAFDTDIPIKNIIETSDGGVVLVGDYVQLGKNARIYAMKIDQDGKKQWWKIYTDDRQGQFATSIYEQPDGYIIIGRKSIERPDTSFVFVKKIDQGGQELSENLHGSRVVQWTLATTETTDGGFAIVGTAGDPEGVFMRRHFDFHFLKVNDVGDLETEWSWGAVDPSEEVLSSVTQTPDGHFAVTGTVNSSMYVAKLHNPLVSVSETNNAPFVRLSINPHPLRSTGVIEYTLPAPAVVSLQVFDLRGIAVIVLPGQAMRTGTYHVPLDVSGLTNGIYFVRLEADDKRTMWSLVVFR